MDSDRSKIAALLQREFQAMEAAGGDIMLPAERQRRILLVAEHDWPPWAAFKSGGPLPSNPAAPVMLRRVAAATYRLASLSARRDAVGS